MTELLTSARMRAIEQAAIDSGAVTGLSLMEAAGRGVLDAVFRWQPALARAPHRTVVLCGPGNNGGDGYVVARLLRDLHWDVDVHALAPPGTPDAQAMAARWGDAVLPLDEALVRARPDADLYVDALFGTGLTRAPEGDLLSLLRHLGGFGGDAGVYRPRLVAVDAPSGLCLDSGRLLAGGAAEAGASTAPLAGLTVTFEAPKIGHFIAEGPGVCGRLEVVDLGLAQWRGTVADPSGSLARAVRPARVQLIDAKPWAAPCANDPLRPLTHVAKGGGDRNKFDHGHVLVVAGGMGRTGAARLAARAALRVGAGLVTVAAPGAAMMECATQLTAIMLRRCDDAAALTALLEDDRIRCVVIGPGLGLSPDKAAMVGAVLASGKACVLDADALTLIAGDPALRAALHKDCVLTPHMGEFRRLWPDLADRLLDPQARWLRATRDMDPVDRLADMASRPKGGLTGPAFSKVDAAQAAAADLKCGVVIKGPDTVYAPFAGMAFVHACAYGREVPWLATAGAGDVLAGLIGGQLAKAPNAALSVVPPAIWLHAEAARAFGPGLIAEDLPEAVPMVLRGDAP